MEKEGVERGCKEEKVGLGRGRAKKISIKGKSWEGIEYLQQTLIF